MTLEFFSQKDWVLVPIYLSLFFFITKFWVDRNYSVDSTARKYIFPALGIKLLGCLASVLIQTFYYKGGDTVTYFETGFKINDIFWQEPLEALDIIVSPANHFSPKQWELLGLNIKSPSFRYESNALMCRIGGILSFIAFKSCLCISLFTCYLSFLGSWKLFLTFKDLYPQYEKEVAICMLFIPSVSFWGGGGLQKETILMANLGYFIYSFYWLIIKKHFSYKLLFTFLISFIFISTIRTYAAMVLIPAVSVWVTMHYFKNMISVYQKIFLILSLPIFCFFSIYIISQNTTKYNFNSIVKYMFSYQRGNSTFTDVTNGQGYDLYMPDNSLLSVFKSSPRCILTALYKPSLLDATKPFSFLAGFENLAILLLTILSINHIIQHKLIDTLKILSRPDIVFCFFYALGILFIVGFTSMNFGGLVRLRISALPFLIMGLLAICKSNDTNIKLV